MTRKTIKGLEEKIADLEGKLAKSEAKNDTSESAPASDYSKMPATDSGVSAISKVHIPLRTVRGFREEDWYYMDHKVEQTFVGRQPISPAQPGHKVWDGEVARRKFTT